jgi:hypothetical protein
MADLTVTASQVAQVFPMESLVRTYKAAVALDAGTPVYIDANGKVNKADANGSSPVNRFRGITLETVGAGQDVDVISEGEIAGFDLSGLAYDAEVFVSDTVGKLADAAGTTSLSVGRVHAMNDGAKTKVLRLTGWAG